MPYDPLLVATSGLQRARFLLGDVENAALLLTDEEIAGMIAAFGWTEGVAQCADSLVSRFAQDPTSYEDEGGMKVNFYQRMEAWEKLAKRLRSGEIRPLENRGLGGGPASGELANPPMSGVRP